MGQPMKCPGSVGSWVLTHARRTLQCSCIQWHGRWPRHGRAARRARAGLGDTAAVLRVHVALAMADHLPPDGLDATYLPDVAESGNDWRKSAGDFACAVCGKKRLTAMSFSKSQVGFSYVFVLLLSVSPREILKSVFSQRCQAVCSASSQTKP